jgi:hypothetical protein
MEERRNVYRILVGKPERKRPLARPSCRWVGNITMNLREIGQDGLDWINLAQYLDLFQNVAPASDLRKCI